MFPLSVVKVTEPGVCVCVCIHMLQKYTQAVYTYKQLSLGFYQCFYMEVNAIEFKKSILMQQCFSSDKSLSTLNSIC